MGALTGNPNYLRFFVDGEPPTGFARPYEQAIEARRFMPLTDRSEENMSCGWVPLEEPLDDESEIGRDKFVFGDIIALAYREDKFTFPRPLVKRRVRLKAEELAEQGEKITKVKKKQIELAVVAELKKRMLPRTRTMDLVWDTRRGELRIFGTGPMATERAVATFERTFGFQVSLASWSGRAFALDLSLRARSVLESIQPELIFDDICVVTDDEDKAAA